MQPPQRALAPNRPSTLLRLWLPAGSSKRGSETLMKIFPSLSTHSSPISCLGVSATGALHERTMDQDEPQSSRGAIRELRACRRGFWTLIARSLAVTSGWRAWQGGFAPLRPGGAQKKHRTFDSCTVGGVPALCRHVQSARPSPAAHQKGAQTPDPTDERRADGEHFVPDDVVGIECWASRIVSRVVASHVTTTSARRCEASTFGAPWAWWRRKGRPLNNGASGGPDALPQVQG